MAAKVRIMKLLQEMRGFAEVTNRLPLPKQPGLFLMKLRTHFSQGALPSRKRVITIEIQDRADIPDPVKITHVPSRPRPNAIAP